MMDKQRIKGSLDETKGAAKDTAGRILGDRKLQAEGKFDKAKGKVEKEVGRMKDAVRNLRDRKDS
jgi:uncharacterized protein YjbJ (UPF0337 family)